MLQSWHSQVEGQGNWMSTNEWESIWRIHLDLWFERFLFYHNKSTSKPYSCYVSESSKYVNTNSKTDLKKISDFASFARKVVKSRVHVFVFVFFDTFTTCCEAFSNVCITTMTYPYVITLDSIRIQNRNPNVFHHNGCLFAIVVHFDDPSGFQMRTCTPISIWWTVAIVETYMRCSLFLPSPTSNLCSSNSKVPLDINDLSHSMVAEWFNLFCPYWSHIIDPFSTIMSTAVAIVQVNWFCVCIDNDPSCYSSAVQWLRSFLPWFNDNLVIPTSALEISKTKSGYLQQFTRQPTKSWILIRH